MNACEGLLGRGRMLKLGLAWRSPSLLPSQGWLQRSKVSLPFQAMFLFTLLLYCAQCCLVPKVLLRSPFP